MHQYSHDVPQNITLGFNSQSYPRGRLKKDFIIPQLMGDREG